MHNINNTTNDIILTKNGMYLFLGCGEAYVNTYRVLESNQVIPITPATDSEKNILAIQNTGKNIIYS